MSIIQVIRHEQSGWHSLFASEIEEKRDTYLLLVSFDGFRWDYPELYETPNHHTLATGLYPDHHGIINNSYYAPDLKGLYRIGDVPMVTQADACFGEPIWVTAE